MKRVFLIDDDPITHVVVKSCVPKDMELTICTNLTDADRLLNEGIVPSLFIIDRMLPDGDGLSFCSRVRAEERFHSIPVIFLSSRDTETDKVSGLFAGADDYVTKPVSPLELRARIQARLRLVTKTISVGDLHLDLERQRACISSPDSQPRELDLTRIEYKLLLVFSQSNGTVLNREALLDRVWGPGCHLSDRVVDTHVSHLRKKLAGSNLRIEALRGEGYRMLIKTKNNSHDAA